MPKVSVIIPFFNLVEYYGKNDAKQFFFDAIESVLNQSYKDFEVIVVDHNSSNTNYETLLNKYSTRPQVTVVNCSEEYLLPRTRNYGIKNYAKGEYICCLDSDDKYHEDFLEKSVATLESNKKLGFVTTHFQTFGSYKNTIVLDKDNLRFLVNTGAHVASLFRKDAWEKVGGYEEKLKGYQDWDFWLSIIEEGYDWDVIKEVLFYYRVRANSMLTNSLQKEKQLTDFIFNKHIKLIESYSQIELIQLARGVFLDNEFANRDKLKKNKNIIQKIISK